MKPPDLSPEKAALFEMLEVTMRAMLNTYGGDEHNWHCLTVHVRGDPGGEMELKIEWTMQVEEHQ